MPEHTPHSKHTEETHRRVSALAQSGMGPVQIAKTLGVPVRTVRDMLDNMGIEVTGPESASDAVAKVVADWAPGAVQKGFQAAIELANRVTEPKVSGDEAKKYADAYKSLMDGAYVTATKFAAASSSGAPGALAELGEEWAVDVPGVDPDDDSASDMAPDPETAGDELERDEVQEQVMQTHADRVTLAGSQDGEIAVLSQIAGPPPVLTPGDVSRMQIGHSLPAPPEVARAAGSGNGQ